MKRLKQSQLAKDLGISKSYLSMIFSGQRKCPPELVENLQSIPGVHKIVNDSLWRLLHTQEVTGSSPVPPTIHKDDLLVTTCMSEEIRYNAKLV